jgi:hypothetical protein
MFQFLLEDGTGNYQIEDGSGNYVQDIPTKVINSTVLASESKDRLLTILKYSQATIGVTEDSPVNYFKGIVKVATQFLVSVEEAFSKKVTFDVYTLEDGTGSYLTEDGVLYKQDIPTKVINSIVGITGTQNRLRNFFKNVSSTVGLTEASEKIEGFVRIATQKIVNLQEVLATKLSDLNHYTLENGLGSYLLESGAGFYAIDNLLIIKNAVTDTIGFTSLRNQIDGTVQNVNETLGLTDILNRLRDQVRNVNEIVGLDEGIVRARIMLRNIAIETVGLLESLSIGYVRNISSTVGINHEGFRIRDLIRLFTENVGITEQLDHIEGIVKYISDTVGFTDAVSKFRILGIGFNTGDYITTALINLSNFITSTQQDTGDMIRFSAYNSGDMRITDD